MTRSEPQDLELGVSSLTEPSRQLQGGPYSGLTPTTKHRDSPDSFQTTIYPLPIQNENKHTVYQHPGDSDNNDAGELLHSTLSDEESEEVNSYSRLYPKRKTVRLSRLQRAEIRVRYQAGIASTLLQSHYLCSKSVIKRCLKNDYQCIDNLDSDMDYMSDRDDCFALPVDRKRERRDRGKSTLSRHQRAEIRFLYKSSGHTTLQLAERYACSTTMVNRIINNSGNSRDNTKSDSEYLDRMKAFPKRSKRKRRTDLRESEGDHVSQRQTLKRFIKIKEGREQEKPLAYETHIALKPKEKYVLSRAQRAEVRALRRQGIPQKTLSRQFKCSLSTIYCAARNHMHLERYKDGLDNVESDEEYLPESLKKKDWVKIDVKSETPPEDCLVEGDILEKPVAVLFFSISARIILTQLDYFCGAEIKGSYSNITLRCVVTNEFQ